MVDVDNSTGYFPPMYEFEKVDANDLVLWLRDNWTQSVWVSVMYVILIHVGQKYMENRPKFSLKYPLVLWSGFLALMNIYGAWRTIAELVFTWTNFGFRQTVCNVSFMQGPTAFTTMLFILSKRYELFDTVFVVLRKQKLIFLHWYHHITVMMYCWYSYQTYCSAGRWFIVMNFIVHSIMYSYYALRAAGLRFPKWLSMMITTLQLAQMFMGIFVNIMSYVYKSWGYTCLQPTSNIVLCLTMYASYMLLFVQFFQNAYLKAPARKEQQAEVNNNHKKIH